MQGVELFHFAMVKFFGGDSGYYYIGSYTLKDAVQFNATVKVKRHTSNVISIFGNVPEFVLKNNREYYQCSHFIYWKH